MVELIVIILILGILSSMLVVNLASVNGRNAADAAKKLSLLLDEVRLESMNRESGKLFVRVSVDSTSREVKATVMYDNGASSEPTEGDVTVLGNSGLSVTFVGKDAADTVTLSAGNSIDLKFSKSTGGFTGSPEYDSVEFNGMRQATLVLVWLTGRSYVAND